jgi:hypothetical protein
LQDGSTGSSALLFLRRDPRSIDRNGLKPVETSAKAKDSVEPRWNPKPKSGARRSESNS